MVFTPQHFQVAISQKITDEAERQRLMSLVTPGEQGGYIFRTAAIGVTAEEVAADVNFLNQHWAAIAKAAQAAKSGELVYEDLPLALRLLRDWLGYRAMRVRVDDEKSFHEMQRYARLYLPELVNYIEYYADARPIFDVCGVEEELQRALQRKVYLKSGGHIVFDQTEAMTTVDVNTGSYLGKNNLEDTIFNTNQEAAQAIAHQVRLRNLGGIIIVDFIDMTDAAHRDQLLASFTAALAKDPVKSEVSDLSSLGLLQMTRKRTRESLEHTLCVTCPLCFQRGSIKSLETVSYEIFREVKRAANYFSWPGYTILAAQHVIEYLQTHENDMLSALQIALKKSVTLKVEPAFSQEQYEVIPSG
jgi:ribonuclease G